MLKQFAIGMAGALALAATSWAQAPDPDVVGPARRAAGAAGEAVGAPGVEQRIENRQQQRDLRRADENPRAAERAMDRAATPDDQWRYVRQNDMWWYYTPQNQWRYYQNDRWMDYRPTPAPPATPQAGVQTNAPMSTGVDPRGPDVNVYVTPGTAAQPNVQVDPAPLRYESGFRGPVYQEPTYYYNTQQPRRGIFGRRR